MPHTRLLVALVLALALPAARSLTAAAPLPQTPVDAVAAAARRMDAAALEENTEGVKAARIDCLRLLASSPAANLAVTLRYTVAYGAWRLAFARGIDPKERASLLEDAAVQLEAVLKSDARNAEAVGLLSAVQGARIAGNSDLGMTLGPASAELMGRAFGLDDSNPRLYVIRGQSLFNTPPEYGGSVKEAETALRKAIALFEQEPATKPWPNWGRFDAHVWLGQALASRHDNAGARAEYDKALALAPKSNWVRYALLPLVK